MRGRVVPVVSLPAHLPDDPSVVPDTKYFMANPGVDQFVRDYVPGEVAEAMPPGTKVLVKRIGRDRRARAFLWPQEGLN